MNQNPNSDQILSIAAITGAIRSTLETSFDSLWVRGEISNIRYQSSGHIYMTLKDAEAQLSAVMFRGNASKMQQKLADGMEVLAFGSISVYEPRGTYQLIIRHCIEEGAGRLQAEFERLKRMLNEEGLFDASKKQPIPPMPYRIAVITSPTGAAIRDFLSILARRNWAGEVLIFPAIVQGKDGAADILQKLEWVEATPDIDLLVLCRGGGSIEDLWNFNEASVVRAVAACPIPTISAIGHEIDYVLTDFAADRRAETPSAAAEQILESWDRLLNRLENAQNQLKTVVHRRIDTLQERMRTKTSRLSSSSPQRLLENRHIKLDELEERIALNARHLKQSKNNSLEILKQRFASIRPETLIEKHRVALEQKESLLRSLVTPKIEILKHSLNSVEKRLSNSSVEHVLNRGYAIVQHADGSIVTDVSSLKENQILKTQLATGTFRSQVKNQPQLDLF